MSASVWGGSEEVFSPCLRLFGEVLRRVPGVDNRAVLVHQKRRFLTLSASVWGGFLTLLASVWGGSEEGS